MNRLSIAKLRNWFRISAKTVNPPYKHVVQIGDPRLRAKCENVPLDMLTTDPFNLILQRMKHVYANYNCCGLSAPQIGISYRIFMFGMTFDQMKQFSAYEIEIQQIYQQDLQILINPTIKSIDYNRLIFPESCQSIKGYWADVPRFAALTVCGWDENGNFREFDVYGWIARIVQHEMDHLNGQLYTDIMIRKTLTCCCWHAINERSGRVSLPYGPK